MPAMDEFKKQRKAINSKTFKEKLDYFWYYYKLHVFVAIFILILVVTTIIDVVSQKDVAFYVAFLNSFDTDYDQEFIDEFAQLTDIDLEKYDVYLDTNMYFNVAGYDQASMAAMQNFLAMASNAEIDVVVTDRNVFSNYADNGFFRDLNDFLTPEQLEKYSDHFYYFDGGTLDDAIDYEKIYSSELAIPVDTVERRDPSGMEKPIPVGIFLDDSMKNRLTQSCYFAEGQEIIFGFMGKDENIDYCRQFLDWLVSAE